VAPRRAPYGGSVPRRLQWVLVGSASSPLPRAPPRPGRRQPPMRHAGFPAALISSHNPCIQRPGVGQAATRVPSPYGVKRRERGRPRPRKTRNAPQRVHVGTKAVRRRRGGCCLTLTHFSKPRTNEADHSKPNCDNVIPVLPFILSGGRRLVWTAVLYINRVAAA
jgi:hypothetical protein